eukprot:1039533-Pelagomonas_calceolata.AAC.1
MGSAVMFAVALWRPQVTFIVTEAFRPQRTFIVTEAFRPQRTFIVTEAFRPQRTFIVTEAFRPQRTFIVTEVSTKFQCASPLKLSFKPSPTALFCSLLCAES